MKTGAGFRKEEGVGRSDSVAERDVQDGQLAIGSDLEQEENQKGLIRETQVKTSSVIEECRPEKPIRNTWWPGNLKLHHQSKGCSEEIDKKMGGGGASRYPASWLYVKVRWYHLFTIINCPPFQNSQCSSPPNEKVRNPIGEVSTRFKGSFFFFWLLRFSWQGRSSKIGLPVKLWVAKSTKSVL